ncbi:uncharacterized protein EAE97_010913 [Botrytis byssoidea]|uniref:Uncharacterized protein n=1 Tax=Botrytis byssoidea TaxID=139641 RepID=A0A9P5LSJ0_9HELO|nr:uncharacterized protein EAE97_010913 [Botrytis byssoidea]KAF7923475.1 hypothetical protein EAE97_010913 [Botrytis byssoidea]
MVQPQLVQGKIYSFVPDSELNHLGITLDDNVAKIVRKHMVICLGIVRGRPNHVKVMTITSTVKDGHEYVPIAPTPKKPYPIQIQLRNSSGYSCGQWVRQFTTLHLDSYLKIDACYEVPIQALEQVLDCYGNPLSIRPGRGAGGLPQLNDYIRRRDSIREIKKTYREMEKQDELFEAMENLTLSDG